VRAEQPDDAAISERVSLVARDSTLSDQIKARLADLGGDALALSPADFGKLIADKTEKWGKVIWAANIKAE